MCHYHQKDEAPAAAQAARTHRFTPAALAEQAMALSRYEIVLPPAGSSGGGGGIGDGIIDRLDAQIVGPDFPLVSDAGLAEPLSGRRDGDEGSGDGGVAATAEFMAELRLNDEEDVPTSAPAAAGTLEVVGLDRGRLEEANRDNPGDSAGPEGRDPAEDRFSWGGTIAMVPN